MWVRLTIRRVSWSSQQRRVPSCQMHLLGITFSTAQLQLLPLATRIGLETHVFMVLYTNNFLVLVFPVNREGGTTIASGIVTKNVLNKQEQASNKERIITRRRERTVSNTTTTRLGLFALRALACFLTHYNNNVQERCKFQCLPNTNPGLPHCEKSRSLTS